MIIFFGVVVITFLGEIGDDDLVVLLSERAAHEIYKKWLDTLHVSYQCPGYTCMYMCMYVYMYMHL